MKIAHRLYLTVVPAILGVLAVGGLAYWGQYANTVPHLLLAIAAVASIGALVFAWLNALNVAHRLERLVGATAADASRRDELDAIAGKVDELSSAVAGAAAERLKREQAAEQRAHDYAVMLANVATASANRLDEVRLPLHILLENRFGDLNDNQEEMLGAARAAAEAVDADIVALRQLAELDLGRRELRRDRLFPADMLRGLVPTLQATAEKSSTALRVDIEPLVPAIYGDQPQLQDALATMLGQSIRGSPPGRELVLTLSRDGHAVDITLLGAGSADETVQGALAARVIAASGGSVVRSDGALTIRFDV